jgi:hypothetical protein
MKMLYPEPDPRVLYYKREKDGITEYALMLGHKTDKDGFWRGTFQICGQSPYTITSHQSPLSGFEAVHALTDDSAEAVIEKIAQRVVSILQDQGASPSEIVELGMRAAEAGTIAESMEISAEADKPKRIPQGPAEFQCGVCEKKFVYQKALKTHMAKAHPKKAMV